MSAKPDRYAVIGNPVAHSKSPEIHARFAMQTGQAIEYRRLLAPLDGFSRTVAEFVRQGGRGANITLPFKLEACALANVLTERARAAGAVNTLKFDVDGTVCGDNTDGVGLVTDIVRNAGISLSGRKVLLLGAGGAARGVVLPILKEAPAALVVANRTPGRAAALAAEFAGQGAVTASSFDSLNSPFDIVINATSASLGDEVPAIDPQIVRGALLAYDMMYARNPTAFMRFAMEHGCEARDGLGMLIEQAAESFFVWRGVRPETGVVFRELRDALSS